MYLAQTLQQLGHEAIEAGSVKEALAVVHTRKDLNLAFIDIGLPDGNGLDLASTITECFPDLRIIIASGYGRTVDEALKANAHVTFISKPYDEHVIKAAIEVRESR